jgi:hypothetical protein
VIKMAGDAYSAALRVSARVIGSVDWHWKGSLLVITVRLITSG